MSDLYGGGALQNQVQDESEEERKKRLAMQAQQRLLGTLPGATSIGLGGLGAS